jgi:hypothetical protein
MKTKVIALRVSETDYEALAWLAKFEKTTISQFVYGHLVGSVFEGHQMIAKERKKAEAKAKRDAKKASANGAQ